MDRNDFMSSLARLEGLAKAQGSTQLFHTANDSDPGSWAGTGTSDYQDEHGGDIHIDENGTDYDGVKKALALKVEKSMALTPAEVAIVKGDTRAVKSIITAKIGKGAALTSAESWAIKGGVKKMDMGGGGEQQDMGDPGMAAKGNYAPGEQKTPSQAPDTHAGDDEDNEIQADANKSLNGGIAAQPNLNKAIDMSPILGEFARAMDYGLQGVEARTVQQVRAALSPVVSRIGHIEKSLMDQAEFNKSFAQTIVGIGQHVAAGASASAAGGYGPTRGPSSAMRAPAAEAAQPQVINKSFGPGGLDTGTDAMAKSQVMNVMVELVQKGRLSSLDAVKYESTGQMSPQAHQLVTQFVSSGGAA